MKLPKLVSKIFLCISISFILTSCKGNNEQEIKMFNSLEMGFENANRRITQSNNEIYKALESKIIDPITAQRAGIWFPKATLIGELSNQIIDHIESVINLINVSKNNNILDKEIAGMLFKNLENYRNRILAIDKELSQQFGQTIVLNNINGFTIEQNEEDFIYYFENKNNALTKSILAKLKNNILNIEYDFIHFCFNKIPTGSCGYSKFGCIIGQSSNILKPGEILEINAGIGAYSVAANPTFFFNKKQIEITENGYAVYKMKTLGKAGKYIVPVEISFINQDGLKQKIIKRIEYEVSKLK